MNILYNVGRRYIMKTTQNQTSPHLMCAQNIENMRILLNQEIKNKQDPGM